MTSTKLASTDNQQQMASLQLVSAGLLTRSVVRVAPVLRRRVSLWLNGHIVYYNDNTDNRLHSRALHLGFRCHYTEKAVVVLVDGFRLPWETPSGVLFSVWTESIPVV